MKLIFIYGPPAVGKLTVAKELSKLTGYKIFHNHLTIDLVESVFESGSKMSDKFIAKYRLELLGAAAQAKVKGLIFTYVYADTSSDDSFIKKIVTAIEKHGGEACFVRLVCSKDVLEKRVKHASRKGHGKIKTLRTLAEVMKKYDLFQTVPHGKCISINTTKLSPKDAALAIKKQYRL